MNVHIDIERIVLDGLPLAPGDEARFRAALEFELARRVIVDGGETNEVCCGVTPLIYGSTQGAINAVATGGVVTSPTRSRMLISNALPILTGSAPS